MPGRTDAPGEHVFSRERVRPIGEDAEAILRMSDGVPISDAPTRGPAPGKTRSSARRRRPATLPCARTRAPGGGEARDGRGSPPCPMIVRGSPPPKPSNAAFVVAMTGPGSPRAMEWVRSLLERRGGMEMAPQCIEKIESAPENGLPVKAAVRGPQNPRQPGNCSASEPSAELAAERKWRRNALKQLNQRAEMAWPPKVSNRSAWGPGVSGARPLEPGPRPNFLGALEPGARSIR